MRFQMMNHLRINVSPNPSGMETLRAERIGAMTVG